MKQITGHTGLTGLFGSPVAHSISPMMHNASFEHLGLDYVYLAFDVEQIVRYNCLILKMIPSFEERLQTAIS